MWRRNSGRTLLCALAVSLAAIPFAASLAAQDGGVKIAVVDLETVVMLSQSGKDLQAKLQKFQGEVQTEGETMAGNARELRQRIADGANSLSEDKLADLQKSYEDATIAIRRFQDDKQREGEKMYNEGLQEIERRLQPVFEAVRDEGNYDLILNNAAGVVVMASEKVDITQLVVERLNVSETPGSGG